MHRTGWRAQMFERISAVGTPLNSDPVRDWQEILLAGESVHRELRPDMPDDYCGFIETLSAEGVHVTQLVDAGQVRAIALWRVFPTTYCGRRLEIDDLVTAEAHRSHGYGAVMLRWIKQRGIALNCQTWTLNSALHRIDAHRFYEREGYTKFGLHFSRQLNEPGFEGVKNSV